MQYQKYIEGFSFFWARRI